MTPAGRRWKLATACLLLGVVLLLVAYDVAAAYYGGEDATISRVTLSASLAVPAVAFGAGFVCGHLWWPQRIHLPPRRQDF